MYVAKEPDEGISIPRAQIFWMTTSTKVNACNSCTGVESGCYGDDDHNSGDRIYCYWSERGTQCGRSRGYDWKSDGEDLCISGNDESGWVLDHVDNPRFHITAVTTMVPQIPGDRIALAIRLAVAVAVLAC